MKIAPLAEVKDRLSAYIDATRESAIVPSADGLGSPAALLAGGLASRRPGLALPGR